MHSWLREIHTWWKRFKNRRFAHTAAADRKARHLFSSSDSSPSSTKNQPKTSLAQKWWKRAETTMLGWVGIRRAAPHTKGHGSAYRFASIRSSILPSAERIRNTAPLLAVGLVLIGFSAYIVFFSSFFRIAPSQLFIERLDTLTDVNIAYKAVEFLYGESILFFDENRIEAEFLKLQPNISTIATTRLFPNGLKIILGSYPPALVTTLPGKKNTYVVTENGVLVYERTPPKNLVKLEIVDQVFIDAGFFDYKSVFAPEQIARTLGIVRDFTKTFSQTPLAKVSFFRIENELHISLESGVVLLFDLSGAQYQNQLAAVRFYVNRYPESFAK